MKITIGNWKTRAGGKARVVCVDANGNGNQPVVALHDDGESEVARRHNADGHFFIGEAPDHRDLISPWTEPKLRPWRWDEVPIGAVLRGKPDTRLRGLIVSISDKGVSWMDDGPKFRLFSEGAAERLLSNLEWSPEPTGTPDTKRTWLPCGVMEGGE